MDIDLLSFAIGKKAGGGSEPTGTINITANGSHNVRNYATASVNVPNSYTAEDEGKIVSGGTLVVLNSATGVNF